METKQIPIYKLHKDVLKDYVTKEKNMFLYVTDKVYGDYKNTDIIYNFGDEIFQIEYIDHTPCDDDLIDFLKPEIIYYKYDYEIEKKFDYIKLIEFQVEEMKEQYDTKK